MKKNIGTPGRLLRGSIALLLLGLAYYKMSWILAAFGLFVLYEAIAGWCLFYHLIGKNCG
jgi:ABC-type uncharacterized transport system permease subunit